MHGFPFRIRVEGGAAIVTIFNGQAVVDLQNLLDSHLTQQGFDVGGSVHIGIFLIQQGPDNAVDDLVTVFQGEADTIFRQLLLIERRNGGAQRIGLDVECGIEKSNRCA